MILPTKYISTDQTLLNAGGVLLGALVTPITVSGLWEKVRSAPEIGNFERFVLCLDMLYILGAVTLSTGMLRRKPL